MKYTGTGFGSDRCVFGCTCGRHRYKGSNHHNWSGDNPSYAAQHFRIRKLYGRARLYLCVDCGKHAQEWSQEHVTVNFVPRCISCHHVYDGVQPAREAIETSAARRRNG